MIQLVYGADDIFSLRLAHALSIAFVDVFRLCVGQLVGTHTKPLAVSGWNSKEYGWNVATAGCRLVRRLCVGSQYLQKCC
jgi:hypothetical protein